MAPFDLDAAVADSEEKPPFVFTFGGETYELPGEPNLLAFTKLASDNPLEAYHALLAIFGEDQYRRLEANPKVFGDRALAKFMEAYGDHAGMAPGELPASPPPSNRAVRRSKQTSNGSTGSASRVSARPS